MVRKKQNERKEEKQKLCKRRLINKTKQRGDTKNAKKKSRKRRMHGLRKVRKSEKVRKLIKNGREGMQIRMTKGRRLKVVKKEGR